MVVLHGRLTWSMATLVATRFNPTIKAFCQRLLAKGKLTKVALIAAMSKLITSSIASFAQTNSGEDQLVVNKKWRLGNCTPERRQTVIDAPKLLAPPRVVASPLF